MGARRPSPGVGDSHGSYASTGKALSGPGARRARAGFVGAARSPRAAISTTVDACHLRPPQGTRAIFLNTTYDCASSILRMRPIVVFAVTAGGVLSM